MPNPSPGFARNPAKSITVDPYPGPVTASAGGAVAARTSPALKLSEAPYPPVLYIPFADIDFSTLDKTTHSTHCPYKGQATYWNVAGARGDNAMWTYEAPYDEMAAIRDQGAFYPDRVTIDAG